MPVGAIDVLVRGAGPVGCVAALALHQSGVPVAVHGRDTAPAFRPIVLSYASRLILERLGVWSALASTSLQKIHVSQAGRSGRTVFDASDAGVPSLGYVLEYSVLLDALHGATRALRTLEELSARCVVHAEGSAPDAGEKRYAQDALVWSIRFSLPAGKTAFERFGREGPLALLPMGASYALVWSMRPERAHALAGAAQGEFLAALAEAAGARLGRPLGAESRAVQPLVLRARRTRVEPRAVYIGNAAQTLHPVAGQGLNLGMRDAWELARFMRAAADPGDAALLARYAAGRKLDAGAALRITDFLAQAFLRSNPLTGAALTALDLFPAPRRFFARRMIYGPAALP